MIKQIDNYMTIHEAAYRWNKSVETVKGRFKPSVTDQTKIDEWIRDGLIKSFTPPGKKNKVWIITVDFMEKVYGPEPK